MRERTYDSQTRGLIFFKPSGGPRSALGGYTMLVLAVFATLIVLLFLFATAFFAVFDQEDPPSDDVVLPLPDGVETLYDESYCTDNSEPYCIRTLVVQRDVAADKLAEDLADHYAERGWDLDLALDGTYSGAAVATSDDPEAHTATIVPDPSGDWPYPWGDWPRNAVKIQVVDESYP